MAYCNLWNLSGLAKNAGFAILTNTRFEFRKLLEAIWLTVINEIHKFLPPLIWKTIFINSTQAIQITQRKKWYIWTSFQASRKNVLNYRKPFGQMKLTKSLNPCHICTLLVRKTIYGNSPQATRITQRKYESFDLVSRILERDFVNYRKPYG